MRAKLVNENINQILVPKSDEELEKSWEKYVSAEQLMYFAIKHKNKGYAEMAFEKGGYDKN